MPTPKLASGTRSDLPIMMTPAAIRELELRAFLRGFACSGHGFNGETSRDAPAVQRLLTVEYERQRAEEQRERVENARRLRASQAARDADR